MILELEQVVTGIKHEGQKREEEEGEEEEEVGTKRRRKIVGSASTWVEVAPYVVHFGRQSWRYCELLG